MIQLTAPLLLWTGNDGTMAYLIVPEEASAEIRRHAFENPRGFRSAKVECSIGEIRWRTSVFPRKDGGYFLPVKQEVRRKAKLDIGDHITLSLLLL